MNRMILIFLLFYASCSSVNNVSTLDNKLKKSEINNCMHTPSSFNCVKVVEVYDGDTIFIDLPDQHPLFGKRMGVRISGIDTPEIRTKNLCEKKKGQKAKKVLENIISRANRVDIVNIQKDKFFRVLGTVFVDGKSVTEELIKAKLAFPYHGEKKIKRNWCFEI